MSAGFTLLAFTIASRSSRDFDRISSFEFSAMLIAPRIPLTVIPPSAPVKSEIRTPKSERIPPQGDRGGPFSDFGCRISDFSRGPQQFFQFRRRIGRLDQLLADQRRVDLHVLQQDDVV